MTYDERGSFKLLRFNPLRAGRGAPAAEVEIQSEDLQAVFWMTKREVQKNIEEFGEHDGLRAALDAYLQWERKANR